MAGLEAPPLETRLSAQPLYARVREILVGRLIAGQWKPGDMLPSEFSIAAELGVSQGTVRKALDEMTVQGLLLRKQGRGTFVAEAEDNNILFRFYRLTADQGPTTPAFPESIYLTQLQGIATKEECSIFGLPEAAAVLRFERIRKDKTGPILWEKLVLPANRYPGLTNNEALPNNVYQFYGERFGIIVASVQERLKAVTAPPQVCDHLGLGEGSPVLEIDRRAIALDGDVVEWRVSLCRSDTMHYRNELR